MKKSSPGWVDGNKGHAKNCLQQSKIQINLVSEFSGKWEKQNYFIYRNICVVNID